MARPVAAANAAVGVEAEVAGAGTGERGGIARGMEEEVGARNTARGHHLLLSMEGGTEEEEGVMIAVVAAARAGGGIAQEATTAAFAVGDVMPGVTAARLRWAATKQKNCTTANRCLPVMLAPMVVQVSGTIIAGVIAAIIDGRHRDAAHLAQANDITVVQTTTSSAAPQDVRAVGAEIVRGSKILMAAAAVLMVTTATTMMTTNQKKNAVEGITIKQTTPTATTTKVIQGVISVVEVAAIKITPVAKTRTILDEVKGERVERGEEISKKRHQSIGARDV